MIRITEINDCEKKQTGQRNLYKYLKSIKVVIDRIKRLSYKRVGLTALNFKVLNGGQLDQKNCLNAYFSKCYF